jgi:V8-like Glu-specific endopeptidase
LQRFWFFLKKRQKFMGIELSRDDFDRLCNILSRHGEWQSVRGRIDFVADVFAGSPRKADIITQLDLDGTPRGTAVRVIERLSTFGQDEPGRESLGVLINKLIAYLGSGDDADFLRDVLIRYPFTMQPVAARGIVGWRGRESEQDVTEKIIGENTLRDIYMLEVLLELSRAVARVSGPGGLGTGFLISEDLLMTNHHVIGSNEAAKQCTFDFNYQLGRAGIALPVHTARTLDNGLFRTSPMAPYNATNDQLDYTIAQLTNVPKGIAPLRLRPITVMRDSRLSIIQHPGGDYKKISIQNNFAEYVDAHVVQYTTSTEPGSSGSPVLSEELEVAAIHHAGGVLPEPATKRRYLRNEGIRISAILNDLRQNAPEIYKRVAS